MARDTSGTLEAVQEHFASIGFPAEFMEEEGVRSLFVGVPPDGEGRERFVSLAFVPGTGEALRSLLLLQLYSRVPCRVDPDRRTDLERYLTAASARLAIGHLGLSERDGVFLRHVNASPADRPFDVDETAELVGFFVFMQDLLAEGIEAVASGKTSLEQGLAALRA